MSKFDPDYLKPLPHAGESKPDTEILAAAMPPPNLDEFVSDYLQCAEGRVTAKSIAIQYLDQYLEDGKDFDAEVKRLTPQIRYYL